MNKFEIINETNIEVKELEQLGGVVEFTLKYQNIDKAIFNIIIVDEDTIRNINREYRKKDSVTDVISFALEDDETFIKTEFRVLGDIYICIKKALEQANTYGHSLMREISFLTVHGILHLLGYDHMNESDEKIMFELQERILDEYGIKR